MVAEVPRQQLCLLFLGIARRFSPRREQCVRLLSCQHRKVKPPCQRAILAAPCGDERSRQWVGPKPGTQFPAAQTAGHIVYYPKAKFTVGFDHTAKIAFDLFRGSSARRDAELLCDITDLTLANLFPLPMLHSSFGVIVSVGPQPEDTAGIGRTEMQRVLLSQQGFADSAQ